MTADQLALYGKDFALNNNPYDEHYQGFNHQNRGSIFTYANLKWEVSDGKYIEDHLYWYEYQNNTKSPQSVADLVNPNPGPQISPSSAPIDYVRVIREHADIIGHIHIADFPDRHEPGTGSTNFDEIFSVLTDISWAGFIGCEYIPSSTTEGGLKWLEKKMPEGRVAQDTPIVMSR